MRLSNPINNFFIIISVLLPLVFSAIILTNDSRVCGGYLKLTAI